MSRFSAFLVGVAVGCGGMYGALKFHVLRTADGFEFVPKLTMTLDGTYLDVRQFTPGDWSNHKQVLAAIAHARKDHLLKDSAVRQMSEGMHGLLSDLGFTHSES